MHTPAPSKVEGVVPSDVGGALSSKSAHLLILLAITALFTWLFARFLLRPLYLAESDLYAVSYTHLTLPTILRV